MTRSRSRNEFLMLEPLGLQACSIRGDGNCLFNALSDQVYGDQNRHAEIRVAVIQYLREHPDEFKPFLAVGGGQRRNPKRKNAGAMSSSFSFAAATDAETDAAYEAHLEQMAKGGTWGDNIEIQAFAHAYKTDVKIYNFDSVYHVKASPDNIVRPAAHIARHSWEHYSSIRNINGPMTGLPYVQGTIPTGQHPTADATVAEHASVEDWKVKAVTSFLPHLINQAAIIKALELNGGDINNAVSKLLDAEYISSQSTTPATLSSPGSSSIERDSDSDDDEVIYRPSKRQNRSMEPERSILNENITLRMQVAQSSSNTELGVGTGIDYDGAQGPQNSGTRLIKTGTTSQKRKEQRKKRIAKSKAVHTSDATSSDSEPEPEWCLLKPKDTATKSTLIDMGEETEDDIPDVQAHPTMANINFNTSKAKKDLSKAKKNVAKVAKVTKVTKGLTYPSDSEADDEYQLDGGDDADSDFAPDTAIPAHKNSNLTKASGKLLQTTIKNFNQNSISSSIEKVSGMKVLFI